MHMSLHMMHIKISLLNFMELKIHHFKVIFFLDLLFYFYEYFIFLIFLLKKNPINFILIF